MNFSMAVETKIFNQHVRDFNRKINVSTEKVIKKFAFDVLARIIRHTPVDTGQARGGWFLAMEKLGESSAKSVEINVSKGSKRFSQEEFEKGKAKGGFTDHTKGVFKDKWVEIVNGVEHIIFLEYGHSKAAPYGMARLSMREIRKGELPKNMTAEMKKDWKSFS